jgi:crotonobetainyl-CoA:carnitine CoA-transferase CaiB-like acyl-CoA transferase
VTNPDSDARGPLAGVRVLDLTHYIAGPVCTKLLAQLGADVIKIERPDGGDGSRRLGPFPNDTPHPEQSGAFLYLNTGKRSVTLDLKDPTQRPRLLALIEAADLLVENFAPRVMPSLGFDFPTLHRINRRLVYTSISNFGQWGPYRDLPATEITSFALGGLMYLIGYPDQPPLKFGAHPALYMAGLAGFTGSLAALLGAEMSGEGRHVDVSIQEAVASSHFQALDQYAYLGTVLGRNYMMMSFPCADDFVGCAIQPHQWPRFLDLVDIPELRQIGGGSILDRQADSEEIEALILPWMLERTKAEIYRLGQEAGLPFSYVATIKDLVESPQYQARGFFTPIDHPVAGMHTYPGIPYRMTGVPRVEQRAPLLGEHTDEVRRAGFGTGSPRTADERVPNGARPAPKTTLPLSGVRILDFGIYQSAPYCGRLLGDLGAEVIKVESTRRPDPLRLQARGLYPNGDPGANPWNRSAMINNRNRSKLGLTLDLTTEDGRSLCRRLVSISEVVLENFSTRVMGGFGLDYPALTHIKPDIIMISIGSQGRTGPEAHYVSFGTTLEQTGGLMGITGYPGTATGFSGVAYPDSLAGLFATGLVIAALRYRRRSGKGAYIDLSQRELTTAAIGEAALEYTISGRLPGPQGNRQAQCAPQGAYRCRGDDRWVALSITSVDQWRTLCALLDRPDLAHDERFASLSGRQQHHDLLDTAIEAWTCTRDRDVVARSLLDAGIPAGAVLTAEDLFRDPHLLARGFFEEVKHPEAGTHRYPGRPWRFARTLLGTRHPAPILGEHNQQILCDYLGLSDVAFVKLADTGVIGTEPLAVLQGD